MNNPRETALCVLRESEWLGHEPAALAEALLAHGRLLHMNAGEWTQAEGDEHRGLPVFMPPPSAR
jgi:CRP/FNR family cyclic AMP-dependent transcriptional regulator